MRRYQFSSLPVHSFNGEGMILLCGGIKGGSTKSTIATNLAIMRAIAGYDVLLVDADDQETSADFTTLRNKTTHDNAGYSCITLTGAAVRAEIKRQTSKFNDIVIDAGGRDTASQRAALSVADVVLVPFVPRSFDIWSLEKVAQLVDEMRSVNPTLKAYAFISRADSNGTDNADAVEVLREVPQLEYLDAPIGNRKAFAKASAAGHAVVELRPPDNKAIAEIVTLYSATFCESWPKLALAGNA